MRGYELEEFQKLMRDLCVAFNRPLNDDLVRVYWDALQSFTLPELRSRAKTAMLNGKKFPSPADLKPIEPPPPVANTYEPPSRELHPFERTGTFCLFKFIAKAEPIAERQVFLPAIKDALVSKKDKLVSDFVAMSKEEGLDPNKLESAAEQEAFRRLTSQLVEALERSFDRIAPQQRVAA